jgi:hypothetical protein
MWRLACIPFAVHSLAMLFDELWFHRRRGLPRWERWGHPADTLTVIACYAVALLKGNPGVYIAASSFSVLFVTKDEWIHARRCAGGEMWLHAFLFSMHPVLLALVGWFFYAPASAGGAGRGFFAAFIAGQTGVTCVFLLFQILYWNGPWAKAEPSLP